MMRIRIAHKPMFLVTSLFGIASIFCPAEQPFGFDALQDRFVVITDDNQKIWGCVITSNAHNNLPILLACHGTGGNLNKGYQLAHWFPEHTIFTCNLRGHGKNVHQSTGNFTVGAQEYRDILAVRQLIAKHYPGRPIIGYGSSAGASALLKAEAEYYKEHHKPAFAKIVAEAPFANLYDVTRFGIGRKLAQLSGPCWGYKLAQYIPDYLAEVACKLHKPIFRHAQPKQIKLSDYAHHIHTPVLVLHDIKDEIIPQSELIAIKQLLPTAQIAITNVPHMSHAQMIKKEFNVFPEYVVPFITDSKFTDAQ